jgi:hypothetical protein
MSIFSFLFKRDDYGMRKCCICEGTMHYDGEVRWNGAKCDGRDLVEKFYKCDCCGRKTSDQWD